MTYRSRGRSLIEVILVRPNRNISMSFVFSSIEWEMFVCSRMETLWCTYFFPSSNPISLFFTCLNWFPPRQFVLYVFWWVLLRCYVLATTSAPSELKRDSDKDDWRNWQLPIMQRQHKGCMRQIQIFLVPMKHQRMCLPLVACKHSSFVDLVCVVGAYFTIP
jgi:hypothetical protein